MSMYEIYDVCKVLDQFNLCLQLNLQKWLLSHYRSISYFCAQGIGMEKFASCTIIVSFQQPCKLCV